MSNQNMTARPSDSHVAIIAEMRATAARRMRQGLNVEPGELHALADRLAALEADRRRDGDAEIGRIVRAQIAMRKTWKDAHITPGQVDTDYILTALEQIVAKAGAAQGEVR